MSKTNAGNAPTEPEINPVVARVKEVIALVAQTTPMIEKALPKNYPIDATKFAQLCMTVFLTDLATVRDERNALIWCSNNSLRRVMVQAGEVGLQPGSSLGQCFFINYGGQATFQIGVWGWVELLYRGGRIKRIDTDVAYEKDVLKITRGLHPDLIHEIDPTLTREKRGKVLGAYAVALMDDGTQAFTWECEEDLEKAKAASKNPNADVYRLWGDEMRQKTVLKRAAKKWPKGTDAARAVDVEENDDLRADLQTMLSELEARITGNAPPTSKQGAAISDIMGKRALGMGAVPVTVPAQGTEAPVTK